jgi:hypothetical protein
MSEENLVSEVKEVKEVNDLVEVTVTDQVVVKMEPKAIATFEVFVDSETEGVMTFVPSCGCTTIDSINVVPGVNIVRANISSKTVGEYWKKISWAFYKENILQTEGVIRINQIVKE